MDFTRHLLVQCTPQICSGKSICQWSDLLHRNRADTEHVMMVQAGQSFYIDTWEF